MRPLDWVVLFGWIVFLVSYGMWRGRGSTDVNQFLLAGKTMPWYAMGLSIMATQASAITFISTTAQGFVDGMRFVQFYFGLPLAMVILSATAVPIFHRANVYTAYEYLETRFDAKTRLLVTLAFLTSRGLQAGLALSAPAIVLSVVLHWPFRLTVMVMGTLVVLYTTMGGIKAVTWADVQQMIVIMIALFLAFGMALHVLPKDVSFFDALKIAGAAGKLNAVTTTFDWNDRYNLWSGLIGGMFLALAYFGTDQSQVQRYLTGKSIGQSRLGLLLNAICKVPIQFFILFIGAMVFVVTVFDRPPLLFHPVAMDQVKSMPQYSDLEARYGKGFDARQAAARKLKDSSDPSIENTALAEFRAGQKAMDDAHAEAITAVKESDINYVFLHFVTHYLPAGVVGLIIAVIFTAAMSAISGEINSLATVTVIDIYKRHIHPSADDTHYLQASRIATLFWGLFAVAFASFATGFGALIEAVNQIGSLFYGGMLGVFVLAFFVPRVGANAAFLAVLAGEAAILISTQYIQAFLWYNVIGSVVVVAAGYLLSYFMPRKTVLRANP